MFIICLKRQSQLLYLWYIALYQIINQSLFIKYILVHDI